MANSRTKRLRARKRAELDRQRRKASFRNRLVAAVLVVDLVLLAFTLLTTDALSGARRQLPVVAEVSDFGTMTVEAAEEQPTLSLTVPVDVTIEARPADDGDPAQGATTEGQPATTEEQPATTENQVTGVNVTFYDCAKQGFCGRMYNGSKVYEGAAACSWNLHIGTRFRILGDPTGRTYVCEDRGLLANTWVDIFFYHPSDGIDWQAKVGRHGTIEIVN